ncbi:uncharacterized protein LOC107671571 [Sinocyclocheilus anshuiensis]|uniref:uncharacterized protein LOC107671571 n=1 Tax=Sinocyclocheilus anshuiensis TaxID=1608454 RepID=UPI0007B7DB85|nr:PREDICTED: uncharacterized protein LOC107671571 [Sinocyclocheilus anshuiensis]
MHMSFFNRQDTRRSSSVILNEIAGPTVRPKTIVSEQHLRRLIEIGLTVPCISKLLGMSTQTIERRMQEFGKSVKGTYSQLTDEELDNLVVAIKTTSPHSGYRMMRGHLKALGHRVQWSRVCDSMNRVDSAGVLARMSQLGHVVRRSYSVQALLSVMHLDTNHKLITYDLVIFGGIDGYSKRLDMYLGAATNNKAETALGFFLEAVEKHGVPSRVRTDQVVENVVIARWMFTDNQRDLDIFTDAWNDHSIRTEQNLSPNQLWEIGLVQNPVNVSCDMEDLNILVQDGTYPLEEQNTGVVVPQVESLLSEYEIARLRTTINPVSQSRDFGQDIYLSVLHFVQLLLE